MITEAHRHAPLSRYVGRLEDLLFGRDLDRWIRDTCTLPLLFLPPLGPGYKMFRVKQRLRIVASFSIPASVNATNQLIFFLFRPVLPMLPFVDLLFPNLLFCFSLSKFELRLWRTLKGSPF